MKKIKLIEDDYPLVKPRKRKGILTVKVIKYYGKAPYMSSGKVKIRYEGRYLDKNIKWKDLGNNEGYPYVVIDGVKYGLEED